MLKHLNLKNLVLIESCEIEFDAGLTIISGETGAGKTALVEALSLTIGERADSAVIRKGADKASVEAIFDISDAPSVFPILQEAGLDVDQNELLSIRREIAREGKNRAFINCHLAPLPLLQKLGRALIDLVGQHSHQELRSGEGQRELLDLYAETYIEIITFQKNWSEEKEKHTHLEELQQSASKKERELATCQAELQELEDAAIQVDEEEKLFEEHRRLANAQEISEKLQMICDSLCDTPQAVMPALMRARNTCETLLRLDNTLKPSLDLLNEACVALKESFNDLSTYLHRLDGNPHRFNFLEQRLSLINRLKRKYNLSAGELSTQHQTLRARVDTLENLDQAVEVAKGALSKAEKATADAAKALTVKRSAAAKKFAETLTAALRALNMPGALLTIEITPSPRSSSGEDLVQFWLAANKGEPSVLVKESSSGGELSRLMLAIKTALAEKNRTPTLIFDEIDANVGGETASLIGNTLQALGTCRQVLCITHFPQVACKADHHLRVQKVESKGRTIAHIENLKKREREKELIRMLGGNKVLGKL